MFDKIKRLEKKIRDLEKEINLHEAKRKKAKPEDAFVHGTRKKAAQEELQKVRAALVLAVAERSMKNKNIQNQIDKLQKEKNELSRRWVQSGDADVKLRLDEQIKKLNKQIDKLEGKKEK